MKSVSCSWVRGVAGNQIEWQEVFRNVTPRKTDARYKRVSSQKLYNKQQSLNECNKI